MARAKPAPRAARAPRRMPLAARPWAQAGQRIGLMGGSFNPAHQGHRAVALAALRRLKLDAVWWLVSPHNPLKNPHDLDDYQQRLATAEAVACHPRIIVTDLEARAGLRYSIDLARLVKRRYPGARFVWIMGADNWLGFHRWRAWGALARLMPIVIVGRPSYSLRAMHGQAAQALGRARRPLDRLLAGAWPAWSFIPLHDPRSSTQLRARKTQGR